MGFHFLTAFLLGFFAAFLTAFLLGFFAAFLTAFLLSFFAAFLTAFLLGFFAVFRTAFLLGFFVTRFLTGFEGALRAAVFFAATFCFSYLFPAARAELEAANVGMAIHMAVSQRGQEEDDVGNKSLLETRCMFLSIAGGSGLLKPNHGMSPEDS